MAKSAVGQWALYAREFLLFSNWIVLISSELFLQVNQMKLRSKTFRLEAPANFSLFDQSEDRKVLMNISMRQH